MKKEDIFHSDPDILGGTPVFTGTRVPVNPDYSQRNLVVGKAKVKY
jgi:hypothetical protein